MDTILSGFRHGWCLIQGGDVHQTKMKWLIIYRYTLKKLEHLEEIDGVGPLDAIGKIEHLA